ncbi:MAG TPA: hypothetical protein VLT45_22500 [Kofleriaceae bacterium]|nr:hypothetical protein [Kofleriaceae bacterium]
MSEPVLVDLSAWRSLSHHRPLAVVLNADDPAFTCGGTPAWSCEPWFSELVTALHRAHVQVVLASAARHELVTELAAHIPTAWWYVEHGAWRYATSVWSGRAPHRDLDTLAAALAPVVRTELRIVRTSVSLTVTLTRADSPEALELARATIARWLEQHTGYRLVASHNAVEARVRGMDKGGAVVWARQRLPGVKCVIAGLDVLLDPRDVHVEPAAARTMLQSLAELRRASMPAAPVEVSSLRALIKRSYRS